MDGLSKRMSLRQSAKLGVDPDKELAYNLSMEDNKVPFEQAEQELLEFIESASKADIASIYEFVFGNVEVDI